MLMPAAAAALGKCSGDAQMEQMHWMAHASALIQRLYLAWTNTQPFLLCAVSALLLELLLSTPAPGIVLAPACMCVALRRGVWQ
jgi:hypothetical protein